MKNSLGVWIVRPEAAKLGGFLAEKLECDLLPSYFSADQKNRRLFARLFSTRRRWILIMTTGIAFRYVAGLVEDKRKDPGVVVLDEAARFSISLVGGHEGGANDLAYRVAKITGAQPVITTATESLKSLVVGIGCRRGSSASAIARAVRRSLQMSGKTLADVREIATVDAKGDEPGLLKWCEQAGLPLRTFPRKIILDRPWVSRPSKWVRKVLGVDGVCEPCALLASQNGRLILKKSIFKGITVAIVEEPRPWLT